jgi:hypothetical protein
LSGSLHEAARPSRHPFDAPYDAFADDPGRRAAPGSPARDAVTGPADMIVVRPG